jgi:hypothetical protein
MNARLRPAPHFVANSTLLGTQTLFSLRELSAAATFAMISHPLFSSVSPSSAATRLTSTLPIKGQNADALRSRRWRQARSGLSTLIVSCR